jgi:hypothetical protein
MNSFDIYTIIMFSFLGGFAIAWILLCYKTAQAARYNKNLQQVLLKRIEAASSMPLPKASRRNEG